MGKIRLFGYAFVVLLMVSVMLVTPSKASEYEDLEYLAWKESLDETLSKYKESIITELEKNNDEWVKRLAEERYNLIETALDQIYQFKVSPGLKPAKDEYNLYLRDYKESDYYLIKAKQYYISGTVDDLKEGGSCLGESLDYYYQALEHLDNVNSLMKSYTPPTPSPSPSPTPTPSPFITPSPTPTPKTPGYEAIFAIGSLLAVAYLVLRRKNE